MEKNKKENVTPSFAVEFYEEQPPRVTMGIKPITDIENTRYIWRHMDYKNPDARKMLVKNCGIPKDIAEAMCDESTRPRYFRNKNDGIVLIMRGINYNSEANPEDMVSLRVWVDHKKIITLSHNPLKAVKNMLVMVPTAEFHPNGPMQLFLSLAQNLADGINDAVIDLIEATADLEERVLNPDALSDFTLRDTISDMRRNIISIRRYTAPQKEIFMSLQTDKWEALSDDDRSGIREIYNDITKAVEDLDYCRDQMSVFHEELQSKVSISMTRIMYLISIVTVVFTPLTLLTGLLGINVRGIPYAENEYAFAFVCLILVLITIAVVAVMKRLKWL